VGGQEDGDPGLIEVLTWSGWWLCGSSPASVVENRIFGAGVEAAGDLEPPMPPENCLTGVSRRSHSSNSFRSDSGAWA
jgi:hypothetical protein